MDNKFFDFLKTYESELKAFFDAIVEFVKTLIEKFGAEETPEA
jgi:hypothetical protein